MAELKSCNDRFRRFEAIGRRAGAAAHDFNNLLTVIMGSSEALLRTLPKGSESQKLALVCLETAERGADILRHLLAHSGQDGPRGDIIDCAALLAGLESIVRRIIGGDIALTVSVASTDLRCSADRTGLESALINLCINARDAMPDGGRLTVDAEAVVIGAASAHLSGLPPGSYVTFTVRDTGTGMSPATRARATEPFFTTKGATGGTGLGLSNAAEFARQSGGRLAILSSAESGSGISLYLPRAPRRSGTPAGPEPVVLHRHLLASNREGAGRPSLAPSSRRARRIMTAGTRAGLRT